MTDLSPIECDVLVVGSGASGLSAAITAAWHGLNVVLVEKDSVLGGATAWSGGWMWIPRNPLAQRAGIQESPEQAKTYLRNELGDYYRSDLIDAFLEGGPEMVDFFERHTTLQFVDGNGIPDMHGNTEGAVIGGHQLIAAPFNAQEVEKELPLLRKTMRETSFMGMPIMAGADLSAFLSVTRSFKSFCYVTKRFLCHLGDLARYKRAMHLVNGVALIGRLVRSAVDLDVRLITDAAVNKLIEKDGRICGAIIKHKAHQLTIHATAGVVLAAGGFPHDQERRETLFPRNTGNSNFMPLPPPSCSGDGLNLAESVGGYIETHVKSPAAWAPVSRVPFEKGEIGHFPHIIDRGKPGVIGVLANGHRFVNEADGYYDYVNAMINQVPEGEPIRSWLICDHRFLRRYGLGIVRPAPVPISSKLLKAGYLKRGKTMEALANACGINAQGLCTTVEHYNQQAKAGIDEEFGRGSTPFNRKSGDALYKGPNPCMAAIEHGPFYAIQVEPGCFGTFAGIRTDGKARVLDKNLKPITGLYAVGTDMASVMGGCYPSGGINLGPAMTFGYIAGKTLAKNFQSLSLISAQDKQLC